ncbi:uncharacterized protein BDZ99DRAFT_273647 [Mytilinidion resinicola]|uniref:Uncharacterized protein n=1 Tax=Mytilinidion resinicola TaxID=574789 RepID=A0A6A6YTS5_9PEZI|nr:uncharacterized protein BDZ99DRAFT_273647 [Mytilinidion resinicola]KAF2811307.1 hypothetical protein BDZ99DRAFT_273647 [Mytilinidion resinicola]
MLYGQVISGTLTSEPGVRSPLTSIIQIRFVFATNTSHCPFHTPITGTVLHAGDYVFADPSRAVIRLNIQGLVKTNDTPAAYLQMTGTGIEIPNERVLGTIDGLPGAGAVKFGQFQAVMMRSFAVGTGEYRNLSSGVFVGSNAVRPGREEGTFVVGFRMSQVGSREVNETV